MEIINVRVKNFRTIKELDIPLSGLNVFVGQNNHGKTNLFEAINWFFSKSGNIQDIRFMKDPSLPVEVELEFSGLQKAMGSMTNEKKREAITKIFGKEDKLKVKRSTEFKEGKERTLYDANKKTWENTFGADSTWNDLLPQIEYVSTKTYLDDVAKYGRTTPISKMLSGVLGKILEANDDYRDFKIKFNELFGDGGGKETEIRKELDKLGDTVGLFLQKQFPDCVKVKFKVENPEVEDLFKRFRTILDDGMENDSSEKGDGMQRALMLAIIQSYANFRKEHEDTDNFIFLIDEAELHLHPSAQRALKQALIDVAEEGDQVLLNTHSSVLVVDENDIQTIFRVYKSNCISEITAVNVEDKQEIIYELLGGSPSDLLLPYNFLIVEGLSDYKFLSTIIRKFYNGEQKIQIVYAEGDQSSQSKTMDAINKVFAPLYLTPIYKEKVVLICDKSKQGKLFDEFRKAYTYLEQNENQLFVLPENSIEEYYPKPWKKNAEETKILGDNGEKTILAQECAENITQEEFEKHMSVFYDALKQCWKLAYK